MNKKLNQDDSHWIKPTIRKISINNPLFPIDNTVIYDENNEIDLMADFEIVDENCFKLFIIGIEKNPDI